MTTLTRRERIEARLARRRQWRESAVAAANAAANAATSMLRMIPAGQPILVGHHSEKRHRGHLARIDSAIDKSLERDRMATRHASVADSLEHALERSVFSDDANAIEALQARRDATASDADLMVAVNAAWRKAKRPNLREPAALASFVAGYSETEADRIRSAMRYRYEANPQPFPAYCISNARARARKDKLRQQDVAEQQSRAAAAQDAPTGCSVAGSATWSVVTFAAKPSRDVLQALRDAGYRWGGGSWQGAAEKLPECVRAMASRP